MNSAGIIAMILGALIVCSRGPLLFAPRASIRLFREAIKTNNRTRVLGAFAVLLAGSMMWSGASQGSSLETIMFIFGVFFLVFTIPALVLFPHVYMSIADEVLPDDSGGRLLGWRVIGLAGIVIGGAIFWIGVDALSAG